MSITYYNAAPNYPEVPQAVELWNDAPALIHIVASADPSTANIVIHHDSDPDGTLHNNHNGTYLGVTSSAGCGAHAFFVGQANIWLNDAASFPYGGLGGQSHQVILATITHELGHALGLGHPGIKCALMAANLADSSSCGVHYPVVDDIKGVAALYGWASDTGFSFSAANSGSVSSFTPPTELKVVGSPSQRYATLWSNAGLPDSRIAVMWAYVVPNTAYRFHIMWGWPNGGTAIELDSDGIKFIMNAGVSSFAGGANAGTSYLLELVIEPAVVTAYAWKATPGTPSEAEQLLGTYQNGLIADWSSVNRFEVSVWTDNSGNPSDYTLNHFWNFQGAAGKTLLGDFSLTAASPTVTFQPGYIGSSSISITSVNDFTGVVRLIPLNNYAEVSVTCDTHYPGDSGLGWIVFAGDRGSTDPFTCTFTSSTPGSYPIDIEACVDSGAAGYQPCHIVTVTVNVEDFSVSSTAITFQSRSSGTSSITISSLYGFSGPINFSNLSVSPGGLTCSLSPSSITTSGTVILTCNGNAPGSYTVTFTASSGSITHTVRVPVYVTDFSVDVKPLETWITTVPGETGYAHMTINGINGFTGTVTLSYNPLPSGLTCNLSPSSITLPGSSTGSTLSCSANRTGNYTVTVIGTSGSLSHTGFQITFQVEDFSFYALGPSTTIPIGSENGDSFNIASINILTWDYVDLSLSTSSPSISCWFSGGSTSLIGIAMQKGSWYNIPMSCTAGGPAGVYLVTVRAASEAHPVSHSATVSVTVTDFSISGSAVSFKSGSQGTNLITLTSLSGFPGNGLPGTVLLTVTTPSGVSANCPSSTTLSSGRSVTLQCSYSSSASGQYAVTVNATYRCNFCSYSGQLTRLTTFTVTVQDFTIWDDTLFVVQGSSGSEIVTVGSLYGFSDPVTLTAFGPAGAAYAFNPIQVAPGGSGSMLTVSANSTVGPNSYIVTITGTSGTLTHTWAMTLRVVRPSFTSALPAMTFAGPDNSPGRWSVTLSTAFTVSTASSQYATGSITLTTIDTATGANVYSNSIWISFSLGGAGTYQITTEIPTPGPWLSTDCWVDVGASSLTCSSLSRSPDINHDGVINILDLSAVSGAFGSSVGSSSYRYDADLNADGKIDILDLSIVSGRFGRTTSLPLLTVTATPSTQKVTLGTNTVYNVTLTSVNGYSDNLLLSSNPPPGGSCSFTTNPITLPAGRSVSTSMTCTTARSSAGTYTLTPTASSGSLSSSASVTLVVTDFSISASPSSVAPTSISVQANSTITVIYLNGYTGTVSLTAAPQSGLSCSPLSTSITNSSSYTLSCNSNAAGAYPVTVTGTRGSISHSVTVTFQVVDFRIISSTLTPSVPKGSSTTVTLRLTSLNGYSGTITLSSNVSPLVNNQPTCIFTPSSITLSANGSGTVSLTISTTSGTPRQQYTITITANSGSITHTTTLTLTVT